MAVTKGSRSPRDECENAFLTFGADLNAKLTPKEFAHALHLAGRSPSKDFVRKCKAGSREASGKLSFKDFENAMTELEPIIADDLIEAFKKLDRNRDGYLTHSELMEAMTSGGEAMSGEEVDLMIKEADKDGNGKVDYEEFCAMIADTAKATRARCIKGTVKEKEPRAERRRSPSRPRPSSSEARSEDSEAKIDKAYTRWDNVHAKGTFYAMDDENGRYCTSHMFALMLNDNSEVTITMEKDDNDRFKGDLDYTLFVLRSGAKNSYKLIGTSPTKIGTKLEFQLKLKKGEYMVVPFTTASRIFKQDTSSKEKATTKVNDRKKLSSDAKRAIKEIFSRADLDENDLMSRQEFDLLQIQTTGEPTSDEAWDYMITECECKKDELTEDGFVDLYQQMMDAEGPDAVLDDLVKLGYSRTSLRLTEASTFKIFAYAGRCEPELEVTLFEHDIFQQAVQSSIVEKGTTKNLKNDCILYSFESRERCAYAIENGRGREQKVLVDCSGSKNVVTNQKSLKQNVKLKGGEFTVLHHLTPESDKKAMVPRILCETK